MDDNEGVESAPLTLHFRTIAGEKKTLETTSDLSLLELKERLVTLVDIPLEQQRLVYAGRVLKEDDATLASYNLKSGETVNVAKLASNRLDQTGGSTGAALSPSGSGVPSRPPVNSFGLPSGITLTMMFGCYFWAALIQE